MGSTNGTGRVVMVSGANRGIGAAIAHRLATDGHRLSLGARRRDELTQQASDIDPDRILLNYYEATNQDSARRWVGGDRRALRRDRRAGQQRRHRRPHPGWKTLTRESSTRCGRST